MEAKNFEGDNENGQQGLVVYEGGADISAQDEVLVKPVFPQCSEEVAARVRQLNEEGCQLSDEERNERWARLEVEEPAVFAHLVERRKYREALREYNDRVAAMRQRDINVQSGVARAIIDAHLTKSAERVRTLMTSYLEERHQKASGE